MRRAVTLAGIVVALGVASASAALAAVIGGGAGPPSVTFSTPSSDGATLVTAPVNLNGIVSRPGGTVDNVKIEVVWSDSVPGRPKAAHPAQSQFEPPPSGQSSYEWGINPVLGSNGQYTVTVTGYTDGGPGTNMVTTPVSETFIVNVPPAAPSNLTEQVSLKSRTVSLNWSPNQEADIIGYDILRAGPTSTSPFTALNGVLAPATSYTDKEVASEAPGTYRYELVAVRPSGDGKSLDNSGPSIETDATFTSAAIGPPPAVPTSSGPSGTSSTTGTVTSTPNEVIITNGPTGVTSDNPNVVLPGTTPVPPGVQELTPQATTATTQPQTGYSPNLPYKPLTPQQASAPPAVVTTPLGPSDGKSASSHQTLEFVAGALLLAVLALFALLVKRSLDQPAPLEAVAPAGDDSLLLTILSPVAATLPPTPAEEPFDLDTFNTDVANLFASLGPRRDVFDWEGDPVLGG